MQSDCVVKESRSRVGAASVRAGGVRQAEEVRYQSHATRFDRNRNPSDPFAGKEFDASAGSRASSGT